MHSCSSERIQFSCDAGSSRGVALRVHRTFRQLTNEVFVLCGSSDKANGKSCQSNSVSCSVRVARESNTVFLGQKPVTPESPGGNRAKEAAVPAHSHSGGLFGVKRGKPRRLKGPQTANASQKVRIKPSCCEGNGASTAPQRCQCLIMALNCPFNLIK